MRTSRILNFMASQPWAILPDSLDAMVDLANGGGLESAQAFKNPAGGAGSRIEGKTAILPVVGPIFPRANLLTEVSGATSLEKLTLDFKACLTNDEVEAIIFLMDSPGGAVTGVAEFAQLVFEARGTKPITSYATGAMASAAYWIGSASEEIVVAPTAMVGGIGVILAIADDSERRKKEGIVDHVIVSTDTPQKRTDPASKEGHGALLKLVNDTASVFFEDSKAVCKFCAIIREDGMHGVGKGMEEVLEAVGKGVGVVPVDDFNVDKASDSFNGYKDIAGFLFESEEVLQILMDKTKDSSSSWCFAQGDAVHGNDPGHLGVVIALA